MKLKRAQATVFLAILSVATSVTVFPRAASEKLPTVIKRSDLIAVGTVTNLITVNGYRVARLQIEDMLKGSASVREALFLASPTWTCDISNAQTGERALYFLSLAKKDSEFPTQHNGQPVYLIQHSGYGRMLSADEGKFRLTSLITLPEGFPKEESRTQNNERFTLIASVDIVRLIRLNRTN